MYRSELPSLRVCISFPFLKFGSSLKPGFERMISLNRLPSVGEGLERLHHILVESCAVIDSPNRSNPRQRLPHGLSGSVRSSEPLLSPVACRHVFLSFRSRF